jgi:hypothetical protein
MLSAALLVAAYAFIGGGMKYVDQVFDEGLFNKRFALVLTVIGSILTAYLILSDAYSATIILALIVGMALSRKIDNIAFYVAAFLIIALPTVALFFYTDGFINGDVPIKWGPLGILAISAISDETLHDRTEKKLKSGQRVKAYERFLYYRPIMKIVMALLVYFLIFPFIYLVAFLAFDASYMAVEYISLRGRRGRNIKWLKKHNYYHGH